MPRVHECLDLAFEGIKPGSSTIIGGRIEKKHEGEIHEGRKNNRVVDCPCVARDRGGCEQMICCDICEVRRHT